MITTVSDVLAFIGFWIAYQWDCPVDPTDVVLLEIIYAFAFAVKKVTPLLWRKGKGGSPHVKCGGHQIQFRLHVRPSKGKS